MTIPLRGAKTPLAIGLALALSIALWPAIVAQAAPVKVTGVGLKEAANELQVSIVATGPVRYQTREVQSNWIVLDVQSARLAMPSGQLPLAKGVVRKVRVGQYADDVVRVVVELAQPAKFHVTAAPDNLAILVGIGRDVSAPPAAAQAQAPLPPAGPPRAGPKPVPAEAEMAQLPLPPASPPPAGPRPAPAQAPPASAPSAAGAISSQGLISLELRNAEITDVISALAKLANVNIVTDAGVTGRITVRLINVTFEDALRLVLEPNGLAYATVGPNLIVAKKDKITRPVLRQYQVVNMQAAQFVSLYLPLLGLKKEQAAVDDGTNSILVVGTVEDHAKIADLLARMDIPVERTVTRVIKLNYIDGPTFVDLMGARLPDVSKATKIDKASNSVVLTASAGQMQIIDALLQQIDTALPQVMIEAMVLEVPNDVTKNLGVAWQTATPFTLTFTGGQYPCCAQVSISSPALLATLNTLIQENKSRLLANPRLAVRDGETARMNIGDKIPFQVINAQGVPSVVIIEAGVKLEVTPRINADNFVTVKMHPEVSSIKTAPGAGGVPPTISTREADSSLTVKDGTPIVLAGLIRKDEIQTTVKVPLLGDIPILGFLFRSTSMNKSDNEVIFVITPHILQKGGS
jgi:type II secretory pathway component GspD/PulD (secretin)